jgi:hypothetical protein
MSRIATICVLGDFDDKTRDQYFINQYEKDGVIKVFRLKNMKEQRDDLIKFLKI